MAMMEQLRAQKRSSPWDFEARAACLLAPSHSGKTHAVYHAYSKNHLVPQSRASGEFDATVSDEVIRRLQKKVLYVTVPSEHLGAFASSLLRATGDLMPDRGSVDARIARGRAQMEALGVELLVLGSFDNLTKQADATSARYADRTQATLRIMLEEGMPMVFVGTPSARSSILNEEQLSHRIDFIDFSPLRAPEDLREVQFYLAALDELMQADGIFPEPSKLALFTNKMIRAGRGRYGIISNLVRDAAILSSNEGGHKILERHLAQAVESYHQRTPLLSATPSDDLVKFNPFRVTAGVLPDEN
ncbi:AAA family ATPase [Rhizobium leguminosarum]|nr:AAA family ATPase [Rhizobium leguminosarum]